MNEELIYHIWKFRLYSGILKTSSGERIEVINPGDRNPDSGPDFFNARLRIGQTLWAGNVEIHCSSSDWLLHGHDKDPVYDNVILHVVFNHDREVFKSNGGRLVTLELSGFVDASIIRQYEDLKLGHAPLPCQEHLPSIRPQVLSLWLSRIVVERLEKRTIAIRSLLEQNMNNWEECFYQYLARAFGFRVNADPFEMLARTMPLRILSRYRDNAFVLESLLFGQSGLLNEYFKDDYPRSLQNEFIFHQKKLRLVPMEAGIWKFMRLRPRNFPTIRLSQFAALVVRSENLFSTVLNTEDLENVTGLFNVSAADYWSGHFMFDKPVRKMQTIMGWESATLIVVNAVIPFIFLYGKDRGREDLCERAIRYLEQIRAENNSIIRQWNKAGIFPKNALQSQALLHLRNDYCNHRKCLSCAVGIRIMKNTGCSAADKA